MSNNPKTMQELISHLKVSGFVNQNSEIYGGIANTWDYGPLGTNLKNKIKHLWIKEFIEKENNLLIETAIFSNPLVWKASGHLEHFQDPLIECAKCNARYRADHLLEKFPLKIVNELLINKNYEQWLNFLKQEKVKCENCNNIAWDQIKEFNLMFSTNLSLTNKKDDNKIYLRPETAQGIFCNYKYLQKTMRKKLPFGIGQIGKAFRNEITPGNFIFRTKEFEQMELEFFCEQKEKAKWFTYYQNKITNFLSETLKLRKENIQLKIYEKNELAHYSEATVDVLYNFYFGWNELWGLADRGDFDLKNHQIHSKENLLYQDPDNHKNNFLANVIEPSVGVDRLFLAILSDAFFVENLDNGETRIVLKLAKNLTYYQVAFFPLTNKLIEQSIKVYEQINKNFSSCFDESSNIGKRYRRHDAIGTPICITYDYQSDEDKQVTIRYRDNMKQERIKIDYLNTFLNDYFSS